MGRLAAGALAVVASGAVATVTATSLVALPPGPAAAEPVGSCSTTLGVIVVVDFAHFGGDVERGCGADPSTGSTTGLQAMHTAGFVTDGTAEYGTRFICRIVDPATGVADPVTTPCSSTPSSSAYWSYWHAAPGQTTWALSQLGVATYRPPPGSVTLWMFGGTTVTGTSGTGRPPATLTPTALRATNVSPPGGSTTTTTTAPPPTTTSPSSGASSSGGSGAAPATGGIGGTSAPAGDGAASPANASTGGSSSGATSPAVGSTTTTAPGAKGRGALPTGKGGEGKGGSGSGSKGDHRALAAPKIVDVHEGSARAKSEAGSPLPAVVAIAVAVALAGAGGLVAWRRRRASEPG